METREEKKEIGNMIKKEIAVTEGKIWIPIACREKKKLLTVYLNGKKIRELQIPCREEADENDSYDYYAPLLLWECQGKNVTLAGEFPTEFFENIRTEEVINARQRRPHAHFTAENGWINDPNGLVFSEGVYHLYFQYNPFDSEWENMSWGHAESRNLLRWEQKESVMYPDENGLMFSGCGLTNERELLGLPKEALLFFYSAAGGDTEWSRGKEFTQRIAYSTDGGATLHKRDKGVVPTIKKENRDPKIVWHPESSAYIMVLWLEGNTFAILRSTDLEAWEISQELVLKDAWECPDLLRLSVEGGGEKWIFWSADGYYFPGDFDGYRFVSDGGRREAYLTKLPYAAQTYAGINDRVVSVSWLRTVNREKTYRGVMALPRELSLVKTGQGYVLKQALVREWEEQKKKVLHRAQNTLGGGRVYLVPDTNGAYEICSTSGAAKEIQWKLFGSEMVYDPVTGMLCFEKQKVQLPMGITEFSVVYDDGIIEVSDGSRTAVAIFESESSSDLGAIGISGEELDEVLIYKVS